MSILVDMAKTSTKEGQDKRDARGRFAKGRKGGPGRPSGVGHFKVLFRDCVSDADFKRCVRVLIDAALGGDIAALKMLFDRLAGRPDVDTEGSADGVFELVLHDGGAIDPDIE